MKKEKDTIRCIIEDNGIGRNAAAENKKKSGNIDQIKSLPLSQCTVQYIHCSKYLPENK